MKKTIKSFLLGLLIVGSLYQVVTLWSGDISDRNFFYTFIEKATDIIKTPNNAQKKEYIIRPRQLGVFLGTSDKDYTVIGSDRSYYEDTMDECIKVIQAILNNGKLSEVSHDDSILWKGRSFILTLNFPILRDDLADDLGVSSGVFDELSSTSTIGIIPSGDNNDLVKVYFIDANTKAIYLYSIPKKDIADDNNLLNQYINNTEGKDMPAYISSYNTSFFDNNLLLPISSENTLYSSHLVMSIPFVVEGAFDINKLEQYVNNYFANPEVKWNAENADDIIYGDDSAVVKYNKNGVLEYSGIATGKSDSQDLSSAYNIAEEFITRDQLLSRNEYELAHYERDEESITFYYDYKFDDIPIHFANSWNDSGVKQYPMLITVENGKVTRYKRTLIAWEADYPQNDLYDINLEGAANQFISDYKVDKGQLEDMYLSYIRDGAYAQLKWVIKYKGQYFSEEIR